MRTTKNRMKLRRRKRIEISRTLKTTKLEESRFATYDKSFNLSFYYPESY